MSDDARNIREAVVSSERLCDRSGFSLLEMLLALAILGGSLAILSRMVETGTSAAIETRCLAEARMASQSKLSEILLDAASGIQPSSVMTVPMESFDSSSLTTMNYSVEIGQAPIDDLILIRVSVAVLGSDGKTPLAHHSLTRWMVDPALGLEEAEAEAKAAKKDKEEANDGSEEEDDEEGVLP